jgi:hypothetical protein
LSAGSERKASGHMNDDSVRKSVLNVSLTLPSNDRSSVNNQQRDSFEKQDQISANQYNDALTHRMNDQSNSSQNATFNSSPKKERQFQTKSFEEKKTSFPFRKKNLTEAYKANSKN